MPADPKEAGSPQDWLRHAKSDLALCGMPKTHDLAFLMQSLPASVSVPPPLVSLPALNQYAVQQRYPGESPAITRKHYKVAMLLAEEAVAWAARSIGRS